MTIYKIGQTIHLHSRQGMYKIVSIDYNKNIVEITCNKWRNDKPIRSTTTTDIKCLANLGFLRGLYKI